LSWKDNTEPLGQSWKAGAGDYVRFIPDTSYVPKEPKKISEATPKKSGFLSALAAPFSNENLSNANNDLIKFLQPKVQNWVKKDGGSAFTGAVNSTLLGLPKVLTEKLTGKKETAYSMAKEENPIAYTAGEIGGYLAPGIGATKALKPLTGALTKNVSSKLGKQLIEGALVGGALDTTQGVIEGDNAKQLATRVGTGALLGAGADVGLNALGKLAPKAIQGLQNINLSELGTTSKKVTEIGIPIDEVLNPKKLFNKDPIKTDLNLSINQQESVKPNLDINTLPIQNEAIKGQETPLVRLKKERLDIPKVDLPMAERDFNNVGNKSIKSFQYQLPEFKPEIQGEAQILKGELDRTLKAERGANTNQNGETIPFANNRVTSDSIANIKQLTGASYDKINKAIDNIITDNGKENNALSKKIELFIDDRLSNGYTDDLIGAEIPPNADYILKKANIEDPLKYTTTTEFSGYKNSALNETSNPIKSFYGTTATIKDPKLKVSYSKMETPSEPITQAKLSQEVPISNTVDKNGIYRTDQKIVSSENSSKTSFKQKLNDFYTKFVDSNNSLKPLDKTYKLATNSKNVGGTVNYIMTDGLVDKTGNKIGDSLQSLVKDIPNKDYNDFWEYALQKHNIQRAANEKNIFTDFTPEQSAAATKKWEELHPEWKEKSNKITKWIDDFMNEWGVKAGTVDPELYTQMRKMYPDYIPTNRAFDDIEEFIPSNIGGKGFVNQNTPIKKATGSKRDVIDPLENIMNLVNRTVRTAKYNEVGQSLLSAVKKDPVKLQDIAEIVKGEVNPNLKNIVTVLQDGKPVNLQINDIEVLKSLEGLNKFNGDELDNAVKKFSNVYKSLITTKNPVFAVRNMARDLPTYLINTKQSNPLKALGNLGIAAKDVATNAKSFQQYKALGGGGSNFFDSNKVYKSADELRGNMGIVKKTLSAIDGGIETFNNVVESAPRLAEFKASLKKTGDVQQALFDSADVTTNFSRGGNIAKKIDAYTPYFNASIQGLDKFIRQIKESPIKTTIKGATVITAPTLLINYINKDNENYKQLDNRTKDNYYLFPKEDGTFIKIPKSREFGAIFGSLAERILRQSNGEQNAFKGFGNTLSTSFSPSNPLDNIAKPIYDLAANKDFANRDIVPRSMIEDKRSPYLQYDEKTTEPAKAIAEAAKKANIDLSPKQIDYIVKSYTGVIAQLGQPLLTKSTMENGTKLEKALKPVTTQFIADPLYSNQTLTDFYDNVDSAKRTATDKNLIEKIPSKLQTSEEKVSSAFTKASSQLSDLNKQLKVAQEKDDKEAIKSLRIKMLDIASKANNLYNKK
jgi:hypothetical protein